ncbi:MAG: carbamoyl-phosphate synthase large subunit [Oscillospiraceae bacterium]|nr:carbamoyl-phosphate synthase large subunit [Oscillospiraceae bacterium]
MPKRTDIRKILIIGSGPIIIGQACEFDYSGTQACKALRSLGYEIVLVNSNPATIMTDPGTADKTYIEPLNVARLEEIIAVERPCAVLPNLGGQSGLNLCLELDKAGVLKKYGVEVLGVQLDAIERGEDRIIFKETMNSLGIGMPKSEPAYSIEEAEKIAEALSYPVVIRPAYTMGGTGGGIVYNADELRTVAKRGISASLIGQILVEESVIGWEELELEVVRDAAGNKITVCFIENVDPMGVHTGDSYCTAPMLTVPEELQGRLQKIAYSIVDAIGVVGGTNVQMAHDPVSDRVVVIEINPRTSRSSALASKATGFPIAYVSGLLACGLLLKDIPYYRDGTLNSYTPSGDYVVVKFARWAFEKFKGSIDKLGTQMHAVGEVMSIGKTYKEAFQKAIRSLENSRWGLGFAKNFNKLSKEELFEKLNYPTSERQFIMYEAFRKGASVDELYEITKIGRYFLTQMKELVELEEALIAGKGRPLDKNLLKQAKLDGFADKYLAKILETPEDEIRAARESINMAESFDAVQVSGVKTPEFYYYSTYNKTSENSNPKSLTPNPSKVMILGGGPNRIGQGIEFDYCCVHAAFALRDMGFETIMVNCNPETVSTDYDTSDKLYFEPLTVEDVMSIYKRENPIGIIVQFGGQTPLNIAGELERLGARILGTKPSVIDLAEDRDLFRKMMEKLDIPMPQSGMAVDVEGALKIADGIGYPLMVRPSYVLGGRGMEVVHDDDMLREYMAAAVDVSEDRPILIDRFLDNALECEADALADGRKHVFVPTVMQHIEYAGVHSGDSACVIPSIEISDENLKTIYKYTADIANELGVCGLMNMQYAICEDKVYVLEANPRASRTVPLVSKVCNISMVPIATKMMLSEITGEEIDLSAYHRSDIKHFGVKEAVFPFNMFPEVDPVLGPEMRSTGEVLGMAPSFGLAYYKAIEATQSKLPLNGTAFISVIKRDKPKALEAAKILEGCGFDFAATGTTYAYLVEKGIKNVRHVKKIYEGSDEIIEMIQDGGIQLIINTPVGKLSATDDSYIRKAAIKNKVPYITTMSAAIAAATGIKECLANPGNAKAVKSLQDYHS